MNEKKPKSPKSEMSWEDWVNIPTRGNKFDAILHPSMLKGSYIADRGWTYVSYDRRFAVAKLAKILSPLRFVPLKEVLFLIVEAWRLLHPEEGDDGFQENLNLIGDDQDDQSF